MSSNNNQASGSGSGNAAGPVRARPATRAHPIVDEVVVASSSHDDTGISDDVEMHDRQVLSGDTVSNTLRAGVDDYPAHASSDVMDDGC